MKTLKTLLTSFTLLFTVTLSAQMHNGLLGNEWINYNQTYYKIKVTENGLHYITAQSLMANGIDVNAISSTTFTLHHNGVAVPVHVEKNGNTLEYIEFYAEKNNGSLDVNLYNDASHHFNPAYSMYSDTAVYFLSWNNSNNNNQYTERNANFNQLPAKETYFMHKAEQVYNSNWQTGKHYFIAGAHLDLSTFEFGEGWGSSLSAVNESNIATPYVYTNGPSATASVRLATETASLHQMQFAVQNINLHSTYISGEQVKTETFNVAAQQLAASSKVRVSGLNSNNDKFSVSTVSITYPRTFNFDGAAAFHFTMAASNNRQYLEIENFSNVANAQNIYLYDITNQKRIQCLWANNKVMTDLEPSATDRELVLVDMSNTASRKEIRNLEARQFQNYKNVDANYIILTHPAMMRNSAGNNPIIEYAAYRASTGYNPAVVDITQLYDQFAYGVVNHPIAIRNFTDFVIQEWSAPQHLFLIGKGLDYVSTRQYTPYNMLIPGFGFPASDQLLVASKNSDLPRIAVGRLAASHADEVSRYLNKIKEVEAEKSNASSNWVKNVVHASGGRNTFEINSFTNIMNTQRDRLQNAELGYNIHSFGRKVESPEAASTSERFDSLFTAGVSMFSYLGHTTTDEWDFNGYMADNYNNSKKYPLFLVVGCSNTDLFTDANPYSRELVLREDAGAAVFVGFSRPIFQSAGSSFLNNFYENGISNEFTSAVSSLVTETFADHQVNGSFSIYNRLLLHYLAYHGDPAYKVSYATGADYAVSNIRTFPENITEEMESFQLVMDIENIGLTLDTNITVRIIRTFPNGQTTEIIKEIKAPNDATEFSVEIPAMTYKGLGANNFRVIVDADNRVEEKVENNNYIRSFLVNIGTKPVAPVFPAKYAIVNNANLTLKASTTNAFMAMNSYEIEIDTDYYFNNPIAQTTIAQEGGLLEWTPGINMTDSTVYYWRVKATDETEWTYSSFIYMANGASGWNQSTFFQFADNNFEFMTANEATQSIDFVNYNSEIFVNNGRTPSAIQPTQLATYQNNVIVDKCRCETRNGVYVQVISPDGQDIWTLAGGATQYGAINCDAANREASAFLFETLNPAVAADLATFIMDTIPAGYYVMVYSLNNAYLNNWSGDLKTYLRNQNATFVDHAAVAAEGRPFAFFFKKGDNSQSKEAIANNNNEVITLAGNIAQSWNSGSMTTQMVGPAASWNSFEWNYETTGNAYADITYVNIYGVKADGERSLLFMNINANTVDLSSIDATVYPYIQLEWFSADNTTLNPVDLKYWRVFAQPVADIAVRPALNAVTVDTKIAAGDVLTFEMPVQNIGEGASDSLTVHYFVEGTDIEASYSIAGLQMDEMAIAPAFQVPTATLKGDYNLIMQVTAKGQEINYFNNMAVLPFSVEVVANTEAQDIAANEVNVYPNPMTSSSNIELNLAEANNVEDVLVKIYSMNGQLVYQNNAANNGNQFSINWEGQNMANETLPNGFYTYTLVLQGENIDNDKRVIAGKIQIAK